MSNKVKIKAKETMSKEIYAAYLIGIVSIIINGIFALSKIVLGIVMSSIDYGFKSIIADGMHSFTDCVTSIVAVLSIKIVSRPRDDKYNYGYERYSSIASVIIASILLTIGVTIFAESVEGLIQNGFSITEKASVDSLFIVSMVILGLSILMKITMFFLIFISGKKIGNNAFKLESFHQLVDCLSSVASIVSLLCSLYGIYFVDNFMTFAIVIMIFVVGIETLKKGINELSDHSISKKKLEEIKEFLNEEFSEIDINTIKTRSYSDKYYIDLKINIDCEMNIHHCTYLGKKLKKALLEKFDIIRDVHVNFVPVCTHDTYNCESEKEHDMNNLEDVQ